MKNYSLVVVSTAALLFSSPAEATNPVGIYAVVDKVVFEPEEGPPERIGIWGAFTLAVAQDLNTYQSPVRGYLYYALPPGEAEVTRKEWADLQTVAGTGQAVAFASRFLPTGRVRPGCQEPREPDAYPVNLGLTRIRSDTDYPPVKDLLSLPAPVSPPDGATSVEPGKLTLIVRNLLLPERRGARYVFEIEDDSGVREESPPSAPGEKETMWSPQMEGKAGRHYAWRAGGTQGSWSGPVATACFELRFLRGDANADAVVDLSDAVSVLEHLFLGGPSPKPLQSGDFDGSGALDLTDSIYLLSYLFLGGPEPPAPFPEAGLIPLR